MTVDEFDSWVDKHVDMILENKKVDLHIRQIERHTIIETDIRCEVQVVFWDTFDSPCGFRCGANIGVDNFYVLRHGDEFTLCCETCHDQRFDTADAKAKRIRTQPSLDAWLHNHGRSVRAPCRICSDRQPKMHFYLDAWEGGHDVARSNRGDDDPSNMAPIHPRCNKDQKKKTFSEYLNGK